MVAGNQAIRASLERVPARDARWDGHPADMTALVGIEGAMDTHHGRESDDVVRRGRHVERLEILLPGYVDRVVWSAARVRAERCRALRRLLRWAVGPTSSPWWAQRCRIVDLEEERQQIPVRSSVGVIDDFHRLGVIARVVVGGFGVSPPEYPTRVEMTRADEGSTLGCPSNSHLPGLPVLVSSGPLESALE